MQIRKPKELFWTNHSRNKMAFYRLSEGLVKRILRSPKRVEEGIAPDTIAMMQPASVKTTAGKADWKQEIWIMVQDSDTERKIISAWRYPGVSKPRDMTTLNFLKNEYDEAVS